MNSANQPKSKCDIVVDEVLSMIARGVYKKDEKLPPESYFMDYFGMSRVTIRESFKKLSMLGVVDIRQGVGTFVRKMDVSLLVQPVYSAVIMSDLTIAHIFDARKYVEAGAAELASKNISDEQLQHLRALTEQMDAAVEQRELAVFSKLDVTFHESVVVLSGNSVMAEMYRMIKETISKYVSAVNLSPGMIEQSEKQHKEILNALASRNEKEAGRLMKAHVEDVKMRYVKMVSCGETPTYLK